MPSWISAAVEGIKNGFAIAVQWMTGYSKPDTRAARTDADDQKKIDDFNRLQSKPPSEEKTNEVRKNISDNDCL